MITTSTGAKKIENSDQWREIFDIHNDTVTAYDTVHASEQALISKKLIRVREADRFTIPSSSASYDLSGLTEDHELSKLNPKNGNNVLSENDLPVELTCETFNGYFTITNDRGISTTVTIAPLFELPEIKAISQHVTEST